MTLASLCEDTFLVQVFHLVGWIVAGFELAVGCFAVELPECFARIKGIRVERLLASEFPDLRFYLFIEVPHLVIASDGIPKPEIAIQRPLSLAIGLRRFRTRGSWI